MATSAEACNGCDEVVASGCLSDGDHWVLVRHDDGSTELLIAETNLPADPNDIIECEGPQEKTTRELLFLNNPWNTTAAINPLGTLAAWSVRADVLPVTLTVNGVGFAMDLLEVVGSEAQDNRILNDSVIIQISGPGRADIVSVRRFA